MDGNPFWQYWYYHFPNYLLAVLVYTMIARFGLSLFVPYNWSNYIWRGFLWLTNPILFVVSRITPSFVHGVFMPLIAVFWLSVLRIVFWAAMSRQGWAPGTGLP